MFKNWTFHRMYTNTGENESGVTTGQWWWWWIFHFSYREIILFLKKCIHLICKIIQEKQVFGPDLCPLIISPGVLYVYGQVGTIAKFPLFYKTENGYRFFTSYVYTRQ